MWSRIFGRKPSVSKFVEQQKTAVSKSYDEAPTAITSISQRFPRISYADRPYVGGPGIGSGAEPTAIGNIDPICASCGERFEKMPGRKIKCKSCGKFNYVRKRPLDNKRVLLREDELNELARQLAWKNGGGQDFEAQLDRVAAKRAELMKQFGKSPSDSDVGWALLNEDSLSYAADRDWEGMRMNYQHMAEVLESDGNHKRAATFYLIVFTFDANGARRPDKSEAWSAADVEFLGHDPSLDFDASRPLASPGRVIGGVLENFKSAGVTLDQARNIFLTEVPSFMNELMPLSPEEVWEKFGEAKVEYDRMGE